MDQGLRTTSLLNFCLLIILASCTPDQDIGLINEEPCAPPCWQMIEPGTTPSREAVDRLKDSALIEEDSFFQFGNFDAGGIRWKWMKETVGAGGVGVVSWKSGIVEKIILGLYDYSTIGEIVSKYGNPEAVTRNLSGIPESWYWSIAFHYPSKGFVVAVSLKPDANTLTAEEKITGWALFAPKSLEERRTEFENEFGTPLPVGYFMPWEGYGDVTDLYPVCLFCD